MSRYEVPVNPTNKCYDLNKERWTLAEVAAFFSVPLSALRRKIKRGEIRIEKKLVRAPGGHYRILREELGRLIEVWELPLKAVLEIRDRARLTNHKPESPMEKLLRERADQVLEVYNRSYLENADRWWENLEQRMWERVQQLTQGQPSPEGASESLPQGFARTVSLQSCPICEATLERPSEASDRWMIAELSTHLSSAHPEP